MLAAVHHAEVVAHRVGEPYGSLVLAVAVTIIEVGLIVTLMVTTDKDTAGLARDTVFAAVMITLNGIVGISLLVGALKHHLAVFNPEGTGAALATVIALAVLCLVVPSVTTSQPGPEFTGAQLTFAAIASLALYGMFVFTQAIRHRDFFLPVTQDAHSPLVTSQAAADAAALPAQPSTPAPSSTSRSTSTRTGTPTRPPTGPPSPASACSSSRWSPSSASPRSSRRPSSPAWRRSASRRRSSAS